MALPLGEASDVLYGSYYPQFKMPGLESCATEFGPSRPLRGAKISLYLATETTPLKTILFDLGAEVRYFSDDIFTKNREAAAVKSDCAVSIINIALETKKREELWLGIYSALDWGSDDGGTNLIVGDSRYATFFIVEGVKAEKSYAKTGQLPDPSSTDDADSRAVLRIIRDGMNNDPKKYHKMKERLLGVSEETANGVERLNRMQADGSLSCSAINLNGPVTKSKFINLYGCRSALLDGIETATKMKFSGKKAVVCGYKDASKGCAIALKQAGAHVFVYAVDQNQAVQAALGGFQVIKALDEVVPEADIFATPSMNKDSIIINNMKKMKNKAIIYNMDPVVDPTSNSIYAGVEQHFHDLHCLMINSEADKWVYRDTNSSIIVLINKGYPDLKSSWSCTRHVVAVLDLWSKIGSGECEKKVYDLPEHLEEKVSDLHFAKKKTKEQADHVSVPMEGQRNIFITSTEPKKNDKMKRILLMAVQVCLFLGMVAFGFMNVPKVSISLSFPKVCIDIPAIWGN